MKKIFLAALMVLQAAPVRAIPQMQANIPVFQSMQETFDWFAKEQALLVREGQPADDRGLFLEIYYEVTKEMPNMFAEKQFKNPEWVNRLMLEYLSVYRNALDCNMTKACAVSPAWQKAFLENSRSRYVPSIQLLLSISAHVNRDLPIALAHIQTNFDDASEHEDFQKISEIFIRRMSKLLEIMQTYQSCHLSSMDKKAINDMIIWAITRTREKSWNYGRELSLATDGASESVVINKIEDHTRFEDKDIVILSPLPEKIMCF